MTTATRVTADQRFSPAHPCPVCDGAEQLHRGNGIRCYGWLSDDGWPHCTRRSCPDLNGRQDPNGDSWPHKPGCSCQTSVNTLPAVLPFAPRTTPARPHKWQPSPPPGTLETTYNYADAAGALVLQVNRFRKPDGGKTFRQRRPDPERSGRWIDHLDGIDLMLYRLPELLAADAGATVFIVEGEKDVDRLRVAALIATCNPMGAGKWRDSYREPLRGRHVVIIEDNDQAGRDHAQQVARSLTDIAASIKVLRLPGLPDKGDVSDWLDRDHTTDELEALALAAHPWELPAEPEPVRPTSTHTMPYDVLAEAHAVLQRRIAQIEAERDEAQERIRGISAIIATPAEQLGPGEKVVAIALTIAVWSAEAREPQTEAEAAVFCRPRHDVYLPALGAKSGVGDDKAGKVITKLTTGPDRPFDKAFRYETFNKTTGEVYERLNRKTGKTIPAPHKIIELRPRADHMSATLYAIAAIKPAQPNPKHGGTRPRCPAHPDAPIRTLKQCTACNRLLSDDGGVSEDRSPQVEGIGTNRPLPEKHPIHPQVEGIGSGPTPQNRYCDTHHRTTPHRQTADGWQCTACVPPWGKSYAYGGADAAGGG